MSDRSDRAAARRATWTITRVARDPGGAPTAATPAERLVILDELSLRAWKLSGKPRPTYSRSEMPIRIIRRPGELLGEAGLPVDPLPR